nr:nuclear transport factor 2 family protein [uncultured Rhodopila sp.]
MSLSRRGLAATVTAGAMLAFATPFGAAQQADEAAIAAAVDAFRKAMQANDRAGLDALCAAQLNYGHSDGKVQTKEVFLDDATSGKANWKSLEFSGVKNSVAGDAAISRFTLAGDLETAEKVTAVKISVLMVWQKQDTTWKLLARQGFKT